MFNTLNELIEKISLGEDSTIEFKNSLPDKKSIAGEICAFANAKGGVILIGVDDNGAVIGLSSEELDKAEKIVIEVCNDSLKPAVNIFTEKISVEDKNILKIEVEHSFFVHKSPNGYFIRHGSSKREMSPERLARLMQSRSQARIIHFDEQSVPNTNKETLQKDLYRRFISKLANGNEVDLLFKRHLLAKDNDNYRVSVAGVLMCTNKPDYYLTNSFIQAVYYSGKEKDANYQIDAKDFKGTLDVQIIDAFKFVEKYNKVSAIKDVGRIDKPQYNMTAIFEALVNAVIHRDYAKHNSKIRLFMFADRLEIYSPGALANTLTVDTLPYHQVTRNELLARLLSELSLDDNVSKQISRGSFLERRGEGVGIILSKSNELSGKKPVYKVFEEELLLTIFASKSLQE